MCSSFCFSIVLLDFNFWVSLDFFFLSAKKKKKKKKKECGYLDRDFICLLLIIYSCNFDRGGHNSSYMYRLISDYYSADDLVIKRRLSTGS